MTVTDTTDLTAGAEPMRLQNDISTIVRTLMALKGKKQRDLADAFGIDQSGISDKITHRNNRRWNPEDLAKLAVFFGVPVQKFFQPPENLLNIDESSSRPIPLASKRRRTAAARVSPAPRSHRPTRKRAA